MSNMMGGGDGPMMPNGRHSVFEIKEENLQGNVGGEAHLKKGPWTSAEDAILIDYVQKHGEGNWNAVQKNSGLARCGKSCRLRWANHLRPELKKGAFTQEEENRIIDLHATWGNKWAKMATELPGRTDNEIKNYWNTRVKRMQRAGLPLYPPDVYQRVRSQENPNMGSLMSGTGQLSDIPQDDIFKVPDLDFKNMKYCHAYLPSGILDGRGSSPFQHDVNQPLRDLVLLDPREPDMLYNGLDHDSGYLIPGLDKYVDYPAEPSPLMPSPSNPSLDAMNLFHGVNLHGSHATSNGTLPPSLAVSEAMMVELPSLQYLEIQQGSWDANASPLPSLESVDTLVHFSPVEQYHQSCPVTTHSSGLLESIIDHTRFPKVSDNNGSWESTDSFILDMAEHEVEWDQHGDINSPLGHTCFTVNDPHFIEHTIVGPEMRQEAISQDPPPIPKSQETPSQIDITRPDALFDCYCYNHMTEQSFQIR